MSEENDDKIDLQSSLRSKHQTCRRRRTKTPRSSNRKRSHRRESAENPPVPQPSETLTLNATSDPQDNDLNQEDPMGAAPATPFSVRRGGGGGGRGLKRNKRKRLPPARLKKFQKKLEALNENLNPIPFKPAKDLDFDSHEELLRRLGLWDFVKLHFDATLRADLVAQLIASYDPQQRYGYVNEARVKVNRADLARALKLPTKNEKVPSSETSSAVAGEVKESEEAIAFVDELVSTWMLLHDDDMWMMPAEIHNVTRTIKDGSFERVDWAGLIWYMVEKELSAAPNLGKCYYASHLQCLIKFQKENMLKGEEASYRKELDFKEEEEDEELVETVRSLILRRKKRKKTSEEELRVVAKSGEDSIELSLGATTTDNAAAAVDVPAGDEDGGAEAENGSKEEDRPQEEPAAMAVEESKEVAVEEEEEQGQWFKILQLCSSIVKPDDDDDMGCEVERKREVAGVDDDDATKERERDEGEVVEEEAVEEMDFDQAPKEHDALDGLASENLLGSMELAQDHLASDIQQLHADLTSGEFLAASRIDVDANLGSSSLYGTGNDLKRDIGQLQHDDDDEGLPRKKTKDRDLGGAEGRRVPPPNALTVEHDTSVDACPSSLLSLPSAIYTARSLAKFFTSDPQATHGLASRACQLILQSLTEVVGLEDRRDSHSAETEQLRLDKQALQDEREEMKALLRDAETRAASAESRAQDAEAKACQAEEAVREALTIMEAALSDLASSRERHDRAMADLERKLNEIRTVAMEEFLASERLLNDRLETMRGVKKHTFIAIRKKVLAAQPKEDDDCCKQIAECPTATYPY